MSYIQAIEELSIYTTNLCKLYALVCSLKRITSKTCLFSIYIHNMESNELANFLDACRRGDTGTVTQLCQQFPNFINASDSKGFTPLIIAVYNNQPAVTAILLQNGADPNAQDVSGNTALMGACFKGNTALAEKLINAGAAINLRNGQGVSAL